ncbi:protease inhibitor I42 family protein [Patescibacteria group bacterium]|nr:protease inhibitor I42 family protein [Patescibacteria group bacterium]
MNKLSFWLLPIIFLGGCALVQQPLPQLTLKDHQANVDYPVGQKFQVVLPSNGTTGFKWELEDMTAGVLEKLSDEYQVTDKYTENIVGAGGEEVWTFQVIKVERSHIVMKYRKPWDKTEVANEFLVTINGNPGDDGLVTYLGKIEGNAVDAQFDDCFITEAGDKFGITPVTQDQIGDPGVKAKIAEFTNQDTLVEIRGKMTEPTIDCNGKQLIVHEIQAK